MALAYGSSFNTTTWTTTPPTWKPNLGTSQGLWVGIVQQGGVTDEITKVEVGGKEMTRVSGAGGTQQVNGAGGAIGRVYNYFLGSEVPTGEQEIVITQSGSTEKEALAFTVTSALKTAIAAVNGISSTGVTNPTMSLTPGAIETLSFSCAMISTFVAEPGPGTGCTEILKQGTGSYVRFWERRTAVDNTSPYNHGWTYNNDDIAAAGFAIKEEGEPPQELKPDADVDLAGWEGTYTNLADGNDATVTKHALA